IRAGRFREDLYYRLNVVPLHCPSIRERREDLPELIDAFLKEACARNGKRALRLSPEALSQMAAYDYPGNVRELKNLVERLAILCAGPELSGSEAAELLPRPRGMAAAEAGPRQGQLTLSASSPPPPPQAPAAPARVDKPFRQQVEDAEREILLQALAVTRDNVTEAAKLLELERGHFYKKMKALGLRRGGGEREG